MNFKYKIIKIIFSIAFSLNYAQNKIIVEYDFSKNTGGSFDKALEILYIDNNEKYFFSYEGNNDNVFLENNFFRPGIGITLKYRQDKSILEYKGKMSKKYLVIDKPENTKWVLSNERKQILGYECRKATSNFRGTKWIVWYAMKINISEGPWKLNGLPGLIMEAKSVDGMFEFISRKIHINPTTNLPILFKNLFIEKEKIAISYKDYINIEEKYKIDIIARINASQTGNNYPYDTSKGNLRKLDLEKSFEWEKNH